MGLESDGLTRYWPYQSTTANSQPQSCLISTTFTPLCAAKYSSSRCASPSDTNLQYPAYEVRCRSWYEFGKNQSDPSQAYFQYPRQSSKGSTVVTGVVPIQGSSNTFYGILNSNFLVDTLSSAVNYLKILKTGYCYLIDSNSPNNLIIHPKAKSTCTEVSCAEGFTREEYNEFNNDFLIPISQGNYQSLPQTYKKQGETWRLIASSVIEGSVEYTLLLTVPENEVNEASNDTQDAIHRIGMIIQLV
jgi:hypothetical protein